MLWGWAGGVFGTGVAMSINRAPQLIELVRHPDASGVSATSWFVGAFGCTLWILYYTGAHLWAALTATAFAGLANLTIALLATWRHTQARQAMIAREVFAPSDLSVCRSAQTRCFVGFAQVGEVLRLRSDRHDERALGRRARHQ